MGEQHREKIIRCCIENGYCPSVNKMCETVFPVIKVIIMISTLTPIYKYAFLFFVDVYQQSVVREWSLDYLKNKIKLLQYKGTCMRVYILLWFCDHDWWLLHFVDCLKDNILWLAKLVGVDKWPHSHLVCMHFAECVGIT